MTAPVVTARPGTPFKELVQLLRDHRIGAVPVLGDDGHVLGVVSKADLILKRQLPPMMRPPVMASRDVYAKANGWHAAELMSAPAVTIDPAADLAQVAELLHSRRIRHVPVVGGDGQLLAW
jgi:CBS domain-containing protein